MKDTLCACPVEQVLILVTYHAIQDILSSLPTKQPNLRQRDLVSLNSQRYVFVRGAWVAIGTRGQPVITKPLWKIASMAELTFFPYVTLA